MEERKIFDGPWIEPKNKKVKIFWDSRFFKKERIFVDTTPTESPLKKFFKDFCEQNGGGDIKNRGREIHFIEIVKNGKFLCGSMEGMDTHPVKGRFTKFKKWFTAPEATLKDVEEWELQHRHFVLAGGGLGC